MAIKAQRCGGVCGRLWEPADLDEWRNPDTGHSIQICNQVDCAAKAEDAGYHLDEQP